MSQSKSLFSYPDCLDALQSALDDERGIRIRVHDHDSGNTLRSRIHMARSLDRERNKEIYADGEAMHGRSIFDPLVVQVRQSEGMWYIYIRKITAFEVEPLSSVTAEDEPKKIEKPNKQLLLGYVRRP